MNIFMYRMFSFGAGDSTDFRKNSIVNTIEKPGVLADTI